MTFREELIVMMAKGLIDTAIKRNCAINAVDLAREAVDHADAVVARAALPVERPRPDKPQWSGSPK